MNVIHFLVNPLPRVLMQALKQDGSTPSSWDSFHPPPPPPQRIWLLWMGSLLWLVMVGAASWVLPRFAPISLTEATLLCLGSAILCNLLVLRSQVHFLHNWLHENQWFPEWEAYGMDQEEEEELEAEAITLLQHGRKFEAIQLVRSYTNCGVNEAKEYIRALESEV